LKAGLVAPLYLSVSWILTVSYQLFTDTAVKALAVSINGWVPVAGAWLNSNVPTVVFIYAFTWIFVLSSVIPSVILGKERGVLAQYLLVLALTLIAFYISDILQLIVGVRIDGLFNAAGFLTNPVLAVVYLAMPYIFMIVLDYRHHRTAKMKKQFKKAVDEYSHLTAGNNPV
jgi:hypothetical protein